MYSAFALALLAATASAAGGGDYNYLTNGDDWDQVAVLCGSGKEQSPIDLTQNGPSNSSSEFSQINGYGYKNFSQRTVKLTKYSLVIDTTPEGGDALPEYQINFHDGSKTVYTPLQFHFHAPSEHTVNGRLYDLELHIVHQKKNTNVELGAVIGVFFDVEAGGSTPNAFIDQLHADKASAKGYVTPGSVDLASFLGSLDFTKYWQYRGSLTTPPCSEGIKWVVLEQIQSISPEQLEGFTKYWADDPSFSQGKGNNRNVQPYNGRTIYYHSGAAGLFASLAAPALALAAVFAF